MLLSFLESGMENIYRIKQDNTALNIVEFKDYGPVIVKMNDTSHIKGNHVKINNFCCTGVGINYKEKFMVSKVIVGGGASGMMAALSASKQ